MSATERNWAGAQLGIVCNNWARSGALSCAMLLPLKLLIFLHIFWVFCAQLRSVIFICANWAYNLRSVTLGSLRGPRAQLSESYRNWAQIYAQLRVALLFPFADARFISQYTHRLKSSSLSSVYVGPDRSKNEIAAHKQLLTETKKFIEQKSTIKDNQIRSLSIDT